MALWARAPAHPRASQKTGIEIVVYQLVEEGTTLSSPPVSAVGDMHAVFLDESAIDEIAPTRPWISRESLQNRFADGHYCIGVMASGTLAAYMWADTRECSHPPNRFALPRASPTSMRLTPCRHCAEGTLLHS
jgi:hypothetical protein